MKKLFNTLTTLIIMSLLSYGIYYFREPITDFFIDQFVKSQTESKYAPNDYAKQKDYNYLSIASDFKANNKVELINNIYTMLDSGATEFTFYCAREYKNCQEEIEKISNSTTSLSVLNNFVHPFNSYNKLYISTNNYGKITITTEKLYTEAEINYVNMMLDDIISKNINDGMSLKEKIKVFHDYIINITEYDEERSKELKDYIYNDNVYHSHKANGLLLNHKALCSGFTDVMAIYLDRLEVPNYKIANSTHVWNAIYIDNAWYHLDLTWDNPVVEGGGKVLIYDYFIITDKTLKSKDPKLHKYDDTIYSEVATSKN